MQPAVPKVEPEVLARAQRGDADAHAALYRSFAPMVFTVARRMLASAALAEDVLQDTFVEVIRKAGSYRGDAEIGFWIKRIAINKCLSHLRSPWVVRRADAQDHAGFFGIARDAADTALELERVLDALPPMARAVVWLHDVEGCTHKEIGRLMGRTTSFSKSQLARAHERLRAMLVAEEKESETNLCISALKTC